MDNGGDNALLVVKANATAEVDNKLCAGEVRVGPVKGCEGERSKVMLGRGRGRTGFEGSEETERSSGEDTCKKRWEKTCPVFSSYLEDGK